MNRYNRYIAFVLTLGLMLSSCASFLDKEPNSTLDVQIDTKEKIAELLTGAYPKATYSAFLEPRTDNVAERTNGVHSSLNEAMFYWQLYEQEDLDTPLNYWIACYKGIAQANLALELLAKYPKTDRVKALYGEAFLLRAYLHFMLVNIWSPPYRGEDSKNDMGIPYITKPEKHALVAYDRGNVYDVYEQIERDLKFGVTLVDDSYYAHPKFHFNKKAAYAFASRFYLYKGDWQRVIDYSNYVVVNAQKSLRNWRQYRQKLGYSNQRLLYKLYASSQEPANLLLTTTESRIAREVPIEKYGMTTELMTKINGGRSSFHIYSRSPQPLNNGFYMAKFDELALLGDTSIKPRDLYVTNVLLSSDEVALNRIEAYAMLKDYDTAIRYVKEYVKAKFDKELTAEEEIALLVTSDSAYKSYTPFYGLTIKQLALIKKVTEYRRQEFVHEGLRWFDIRRFYMPINRTNEPLTKNDYRKTMQLPIEAINRGLKPNPR